MKYISLKKLVEENDINIVKVDVGEGVKPILFEVGSPDYKAQELYIVKGDYKISKSPETLANILHVQELKDGVNITINEPTVVSEDKEEEKIDDFINTQVSVVIFHRKNLDSTSRTVRRKYVPAYIDSVIESYSKTHDDVDRSDFAIFEIDFKNQTTHLKSIAEKEEKPE